MSPPARTSWNPKRKIKRRDVGEAAVQMLSQLARRASYQGDGKHKKKYREAFNVDARRGPDPEATLCDSTAIYTPKAALQLLRLGIRHGMVDERSSRGWPEYVWCVTEGDQAFEAKLSNFEQGLYHGYPLQNNDPFRKEVIKRWNQL
jgi:hypothetical protein